MAVQYDVHSPTAAPADTLPALTTSDDLMQSKLSKDMLEKLFDLKLAMGNAPHGVRGALAQGFAEFHGKDLNTVYRWLKVDCGYVSGRKPRADRGDTKLPMAALEFIAAAKRESMRGNGKAIMPTAVAMNVADANGIAINVSPARVNALLLEHGLTSAALAAPRNTTRLRSLHPNHVHQIDPSLCVIFYMHGKQRIMDEASFNKNKLDAYHKVKLKVWRYVRYDHASSSIDVRYFEAAGENQHTLFDFLMYTWGKQGKRLSHGVPRRLIWDKGSANTSHAVRNFLDAMGILHETHAPGHAWAKGGVEQGNNLVETHFESRLKIQPVESIAELNAAAECWVRDYSANAIKHVDCRVVRDDGVAYVRDDLWHTIAASELIALPAETVCRWFFTGQAETRTVRNLAISFKHPESDKPASYKLHAWAQHLTKNEKVQVLPLLGRSGLVRVEIAQLGANAPLVIEVQPVVEFDRFGRDASGQVFGEGYASLPDDATVTQAKRLNKAVFGVTDLDEADAARAKNVRPFEAANDGKGMVAHSHLGQAELPTRLPRAAQELDTPQVQAAQATTVYGVRLSVAEACKLIMGVQGEAYDKATYGYLLARYPDGVPADAAEAIAHGQDAAAATGTDGAAPAVVGGGLRVVK